MLIQMTVSWLSGISVAKAETAPMTIQRIAVPQPTRLLLDQPRYNSRITRSPVTFIRLVNALPTRYIVTVFTSLATALVLLAAPGVTQTPPPDLTPGPAWLSRVNLGTPGTFPPPRSYKASYRLSWSDVDAARAEVTCTDSEESNEIQTRITGGTQGLARSLYQVDGTYLSIADRHTLHPIRLEQTELEAKKRKSAHVEFSPAGAERSTEIVDRKTNIPPPEGPHRRSFHFPGMMDMHSALLYIRSLPLATGDTCTLITMTAGNPYLTTVKVVGRGEVKTVAGHYQAIECSIDLSKINKKEELEPHKAFKSARVWVSDDKDRLIVKAEAQVFIGTVTLDLIHVSFPEK